jgi:hypothetical protein
MPKVVVTPSQLFQIQADRGFATDEVSFLSLFILVTEDTVGDGGWWIEERGECYAGYRITEM